MTNEEAIQHLEEMKKGIFLWDMSELIDLCISALSENKGEWIPVSKRLPEMGIYVLCACQANIYDVFELTPEGWFHDVKHTYMLGFVKAWQPLPEPYKAESEDMRGGKE